MEEETIPGHPGFILLPAALVLSSSVSGLRAQCPPLHRRGTDAVVETQSKDPREFSVKQQPSRYKEQHDSLVGSPKCRFLGQTLAWDSVGVGWHPRICISTAPLLNRGITDVGTEVWGSDSQSMVSPARVASPGGGLVSNAETRAHPDLWTQALHLKSSR